jgi:hypothetical protein
MRQRKPTPTPTQRPVCTIHDVAENDCYPYRCARCSRCFICGHGLRGFTHWTCWDGRQVPTTPSTGWSAPTSKPSFLLNLKSIFSKQ